MFKLNKILLLIPALFVVVATQVVSAQATAGYLGMRVQNVPAHVRAHMPDEVSNNQGVIVDWLEDISPAADDGIHLYDVLVSYDDKPISTIAEFTQKIQQATVGQKIEIKLVRQGNMLTVPVTVTALPQGEKMTAAPNQTTLFKPAPMKAQQAPRFPANPQQSTRPLNIAGKPAYPMRKKPEKHAWGTERNIWSDFYTDSTSDVWDSMINAPFKMGRMPGGWRAPSLSMPDPITIGDAVTNQMPPMAEEAGNMMDISD